MEKYYHPLVRYLTGRLRDGQLAADVAHDAYLRVLEQGRSQTLQYPQAYLYRTASNLVVDLGRRGVVQCTDYDEHIDQHPASCDETPQALLYGAQRAKLVELALAELPPLCREVFLLRKLEGLAHPDIARRLGLSKDMVEKHIVNAMKHCRLRVREMEYSKADADDASKRYRPAV